MNLPPLNFTVLDTETTGFVPKVHRVIEFASVRVENGKIVDEYEQLFEIGENLPPIIKALTRIHDEDLNGQPRIEDKRDEMMEHIGSDTIIVGQNVSFDINILNGEEIDLSDRPWIDTSMIASLVFPELASYSLGYMSGVLGLNHEPVHRALGDVHATLELLSKCWERLLEVPSEELKIAKEIMGKSNPAYRALFGVIPSEGANKEKPDWLNVSKLKVESSRDQLSTLQPSTFNLSKPDIGTIELIEEPPVPNVLQTILDAAVADTRTVHWIAVKNLDATAKELQLGDDVRVLYPPFLLANEKAIEAIEKQKTLSADEATLLLKTKWFDSLVQSGLSVHGDERAVWNGKLACTEVSPQYTEQFEDLPSVVLLDHRQLLQFLADPEYAGRDAITEDAHVIIDDASMLEDTATKAYGWYCSFSDLRAAAEGDEPLGKLLDLAQIWIERTRNFQEIRYLTPSDLTSADARGLREQVQEQLDEGSITEHAERQLTHLLKMLDADNLKDRITYIEHRIDGSQYMKSVPERVGTFLRDHLYGLYATSLLIPPGSSENLEEALPKGTDTKLSRALVEALKPNVLIAFEKDRTLENILFDPPTGKTIVLSPSKRNIDDAFVKFAEKLEEQGTTLICQGLSGGINRSTATFIASEDPAVLVMTPWAYEGIELPPDLVQTLCLLAMPFDHPAHAVLSRRAEHYQNPFMEYSLPRMKQRVFRLLRTFSQHAKEDAEVLILDSRLETKKYGKNVWDYVKQFSGDQNSAENRSQDSDTLAEEDGKQMTMF